MERPGGPVGPAGRLTSFRGGIQTFTDALGAALGPAVESGRALERLAADRRARRLDTPLAARLRRRRAARGRRGRARRAGGAGRAAPRAARRRAAERPLGAIPSAVPRRRSRSPTTSRRFTPGRSARRRGAQRLRVPGAARSLKSRAADPRRAVGLERLSRASARPAGKVLLRVMIGGALDPEAVDSARGRAAGDRAHRPRDDHGARAASGARAPLALPPPGRHQPVHRRPRARAWRRSRRASRPARAARRRPVVLRRQHERLLRAGGALRRGAHRPDGGARTGHALRVLIAGCGDLGTALGLALADGGRRGLRPAPAGRGACPRRSAPLAADLGEPGNAARPAAGRTQWSTLPRRIYSTDGGLPSRLRRRRAPSPRRARDPTLIPPRRFFFVSSTAVYAQDGGEWIDEGSPAEATHFRARLLLEGEALVRAATSPETATIVLRLSGIYGPGRTRLIDLVRSGRATYPPGPPRYANRIHRDDAAGALAHLLRLPAPAPLYLGVDDAPVDLAEVLTFLAVELGAPLPRLEEAPAEGGPERASKRCSNALLHATGYRFRYPTYREGYGALLRSSPAEAAEPRATRSSPALRPLRAAARRGLRGRRRARGPWRSPPGGRRLRG